MTIARIYALGPEGTFSGVAARRLDEHLVRSGALAKAEIIYTRSIPEALERAARDPGSRAVAPIENSDVGAVVVTQDRLAKLDLRIEWEFVVPVHFKFLSDVALEDVALFYTHPVAKEQCEAFILGRLSHAQASLTQSNVDSAIRWANAAPSDRTGAIVPSDYTPARPPAVEFPHVENDEQNTTRFLVVRGGGDHGEDFSRAKTSLLIEPHFNRPGLLFEILSVFKKHDINLCRIESRPARTRPWTYVFYLDITNNEKSGEAVADLRSGPWNVILLGTFDPLPQAG